MVICWEPGVRLGVATLRVLASLKVTLVDFPLMVTVEPLWKPLPRIVRVAPPVAATVAGGAAGCGNGGGGNGTDSQGNSSELNDGRGSVLRCAIRGGDGEKPLAIFVGSEEAAVKTIDIGQELLWKKNTQTKGARMSVENVDAALDSRACGSTN